MSKTKLFFRYFIMLSLFILHTQCKDGTNQDVSDSEASATAGINLSATDINQIKYTEYVLSDLAEQKTNEWQKFQVLLTQVESLKKGNVSFFIDDKTTLKGFIDDLKKEIPQGLNLPSIAVRLVVLETAMYKLDETASLNNIPKQVLLDAVKELLITHNNLVLQINKSIEKASQNIIKP